MKKKLLIIFTIFSFVINIKCTNALTITGNFSKAGNSSVSLNADVVENGVGVPHSYPFEIYNFNFDGQNYSLYCKDPGLGTPSSGKYTFTLEKLDPSDPEDAAIISIINSSNSSNYAATTMAIRIIEFIWGNASYPDSAASHNGWRMGEVHYAFALYWLNSSNWSSVKSKLSSLGKTFDVYQFSHYSNYNNFTISGDQNFENDVRNLVSNALDAASTAGSKEQNSTNITDSFKDEVDKSDENNYIKDIKYTYTIKGFDPSTVKNDNGDSILAIFNCKNCTRLGVEYKIKINNKEVTGNDLSNIKDTNKGLELLGNYIPDKNTTTLEVVITLSTRKNNTNYECGNEVEYDFQLKYTGKNNSNVYRLVCANGDQDCQDFYTEDINGEFFTGDTTNPDYHTDDKNNRYTGNKVEHEAINLCDTSDCDHLDKVCKGTVKDPNLTQQKACDEYEKKQCDKNKKCSTYLSQVSCSTGSENNEFIIREGVESSSNVPCVTSDSKVNVDKCVIDGEDILGNSYNQKQIGNINFENNSFCKVACIENFHVKLPNTQDSNAGRYFSISATLDGGKQCYTGTINIGKEQDPVNVKDDDKYSDTGLKIKDSFEYKYEVAREIMVDALNMYSFYKALDEGLKNQTFQQDNFTAYPTGCLWWQPGCSPITRSYIKEKKIQFTFKNYDYSFSRRNSVESSSNIKVDDRIKNGIFNIANPNNYSAITQLKIECKKSYGIDVTCTITTSGTASNLLVADAPDININLIGQYLNLPSRPDFIRNELYNNFSPANLNNTTLAQSVISKMNNNINTYVKQLNDCSNWTMDEYSVKAEMDFDYEEGYIKNDNVVKTLISNKPGTGTGTANSNTMYCSGKIEYDSDGKPIRCNGTSGKQTKTKNICEINGNQLSCSKTVTINNVQSVYQSKTEAVNYTTPTQFRTLLPTGVIVIPNDDEIDNSIELPNAWPLGFTGVGVYTYKLYVRNLGQYDKSHATYPNQYGRIWDTASPYSSDPVVPNVVATAAANGCTGDSIHKPTTGNTNNPNNGEYFCAYKVSCTNCNSSCNPDLGVCIEPDCGDNCPSSCNPNKGICLFDGELNVSARPTSPNNVNPNDRDLGKNWQWDDNIDSYLELKAFVTTQEMEEAGDRVFDVDFDNPSSDTTTVIGNNYAMQLVLNGEVISWIKDYNNKTTYADNTLDCYDYESTTGETFKGMFCYSTFIDAMQNKFGDDIVKISNGVRPLTKDQRQSLVNQNTWWTTWDNAIDDSKLTKWQTSQNITINNSFKLVSSYAANADGTSIGIGPAWK